MILQSQFKLANIWTVTEIEYITWKIVPRFDNFNKERIFITTQFCKFGLYLIWMVRSHLGVPAQFKIVTEI